VIEQMPMKEKELASRQQVYACVCVAGFELNLEWCVRNLSIKSIIPFEALKPWNRRQTLSIV